MECPNDCNAEWMRARLWVAKHSKWRIKTSTEALIQTVDPSERKEVSYGFAIRKMPVTESSYKISIELICGSSFRCEPRPDDVRRAFLYYVKTGKDLLRDAGDMGGYPLSKFYCEII